MRLVTTFAAQSAVRKALLSRALASDCKTLGMQAYGGPYDVTSLSLSQAFATGETP